MIHQSDRCIKSSLGHSHCHEIAHQYQQPSSLLNLNYLLNSLLNLKLKGVDGLSQRGTGTRETKVMLDGWCVGGLRQQRNEVGGCAKDRKE